MHKQAAISLVQATLHASFDQERFTHLVANILNHAEAKPFDHTGNYIPHAYADSISRFQRVLNYRDPHDKIIDVLIVHLKKSSSLIHARSTQRNFIARYLNGGRGMLRDAALVAFVPPDHPADWRFSFIKMEYKTTATGRIQEQLPPAKRHSFLVGENESSHTAKTQILPLLSNDDTNPALKDLEEMFAIEPVDRAFFTEYRDLFLHTQTALEKILKTTPAARAEFTSKNIDPANFAKKLLGQIVFLYFLQKKGWFGVSKSQEWGEGSKFFLRQLFAKQHGEYANFFQEILQPLFYEALRTERSDDYYSRFNCRIPFLNGGLFDPINGYDWVNIDLPLPNTLFSNDRQTPQGDTGTGILDVFDRYNFTVKEDEPLEKEVAVDPEMLGKVFENLLEVKDRKAKGTYYTPRDIVHHMCRQSLTTWLATRLHGQVEKQHIAQLIRHGESALEHDRHTANRGRETDTYSYRMPDSVRTHAPALDTALASIRICDPAVGSGAFPVGMMNEIVRARASLTPYISIQEQNGNGGGQSKNKSVTTAPRNPYHFKRHAIENCLYGVDIDPGAVEIAKLRLWLSLIVDEEERETIQPLPNLDYKIIQGNSLLSVQKDLLNKAAFDQLEKTKQSFFNETGPAKKQQYRETIETLIHELTKGRKQFDFELYFSEVFHADPGGFDLLIANPPYVRANSGEEYLAFRKILEKSNQYKTLYEQWDIFLPFIERGLNITGAAGELIYIVSNSVCTAKYATKLLHWIQSEFHTRSIDYFENYSVFDAGVTPVVLHIGKTKEASKANDLTRKIIHSESFDNISRKTSMPTDQFNDLGPDAFRKQYEKITLNLPTIPLGHICYANYGLHPNSHERYWKGEFTKNDLISDIRTPKHPKPYIEGKDIAPYQVERLRYLEWGTKRSPGQLRRPTFPELYDRPKLILGRMTPGIYDDSGLLCNDSIVVCVRFIDLRGVHNRSINKGIRDLNSLLHSTLSRPSLEQISEKFHLKYLLAILNSSFAAKYLNNIRRNPLSLYSDDFKRLPIAKIPPKQQQPFITLVDQIISLTNPTPTPKTLSPTPKTLPPATRTKIQNLISRLDTLVSTLYNQPHPP